MKKKKSNRSRTNMAKEERLKIIHDMIRRLKQNRVFQKNIYQQPDYKEAKHLGAKYGNEENIRRKAEYIRIIVK